MELQERGCDAPLSPPGGILRMEKKPMSAVDHESTAASLKLEKDMRGGAILVATCHKWEEEDLCVPLPLTTCPSPTIGFLG